MGDLENEFNMHFFFISSLVHAQNLAAVPADIRRNSSTNN